MPQMLQREGDTEASALIASDAPNDPSPRLPRQVRRGFDVVAIVALGVVATLVRVGSLPFDGLWFDDSWVAAGAILGTPSELLTVGSGHPGFTFVVMLVDRLGGGLRELGMPSLLAGIAGPMVLYVALRSVKYERSIAVLVSAALAVAPIHILYSGRVKGYTLDTLLVLLLVIAIPLLAWRTWRWPLAVGWALSAIALATFSGYLLVATACAGVILVLHPQADRRIRLMSVGAQAVVQVIYLRTLQTRTDLDGIEDVMETSFDGHMTFHANPVEFVRESLKHLRRVAEVFPSGSGAWLTVSSLLAIGGLVVAAVRGGAAERLVAQLSLLDDRRGLRRCPRRPVPVRASQHRPSVRRRASHTLARPRARRWAWQRSPTARAAWSLGTSRSASGSTQSRCSPRSPS